VKPHEGENLRGERLKTFEGEEREGRWSKILGTGAADKKVCR